MQTQATTSVGFGDVDLLTREQAWKRLNCSQRHLSYLVERGEIPHVRLGKLIRFIPRDLDAFIEKHRIS